MAWQTGACRGQASLLLKSLCVQVWGQEGAVCLAAPDACAHASACSLGPISTVVILCNCRFLKGRRGPAKTSLNQQSLSYLGWMGS